MARQSWSMTDRASITRSVPPPVASAFTLIEVVVSLGLLAVTVVAMLALQHSLSHAVAGISEHQRAAELVDAVEVELKRLRDLPVPDGQPAGLEALAGIVPSSESTSALRLVAAKAGSNVVRESEADDPLIGLARRDRFYLIEVRQQPAPLNYVSEAGFLALTFKVTWPYQVPTGTGTADGMATDGAPSASAVFSGAISP